MRFCLLNVISLLIFCCSFSFAQSNEELRKYVERVTSGEDLQIAGERVFSKTLLPEFYNENLFQPVWSKPKQSAFLQVLAEAYDHGLNPEDYHFTTLKESYQSSGQISTAELEVLFTDSFLLYASHFLNGKVNPEAVEGEWQAVRREGNAKKLLQQIIQSENIASYFNQLEPQSQNYSELILALRKYRQIAEMGGWDPVQPGETLKPGMNDNRVAQLKRRLSAEGYYSPNEVENNDYSESLQQAVIAFQKHHGLDPDGNVGKQTLAALNTPVEVKIDKIKVNLERFRWINQNLGDHYIFINIADFTMKVYRADSLTFKQSVVVGKPFRKTPVFSDRMTYFVLNPYWTVPPTILFNDVLPEVKKSTEYLRGKNMKVLRGSQEIDPESVDWSSLSRSNFPYTIRQDPGPANALGAVKFMFPNKYNIYIHDTPSKELFNRPDRAFSSGCVRLNKPLAFAEYLIQDMPEWNLEKLNSVLKGGKDKTVMLKTPLNVHLLYLTAWSDEDGLQFRNDVYDRDKSVLKALVEVAPAN